MNPSFQPGYPQPPGPGQFPPAQGPFPQPQGPGQFPIVSQPGPGNAGPQPGNNYIYSRLILKSCYICVETKMF